METYFGYVRTPADAIKLFEACRMGLLPRVQRRLSEKERQSIRSGSVFVWDEREAGMRRWTDGKSWSASRVSGSFLTYREMEGKRGGGFSAGRRGSNKTPESGRGSDEDHDNDEPEGYRYKADGLMKQSFSITTSTGQHLHLISYYSRPQHGQPDLPQPTNDPALRHIVPVKGMYPESSMGETNQTPALTRAPMQQAPYMMPTGPQHGHPMQGYAPHYAQPGYGWSPAPAQAQAPHYTHYTTSPYQPAGHPMPPQHMGAYMPPHPSQHEPRASLPLPPPQKAALPPYQGNPYQQRFPSPSPAASEPPRGPGLQAAAQAVMVDPRLNTESARNPRGPLPALNAVATSSLPSPTGELTVKREQSATPPQTSHSNDGSYNAASRGSISSLLYTHTPPAGEYSSGNTTSSAAPEPPIVSEDTRALRMLDRSAFRQAAPVHAHG